MTVVSGLTNEQEAFATYAGGVFLHACPGAGKTRTIVARLAEIAATLPPRRGVAVLSFTNSAVDEFRERCQHAGLGSLLNHPYFIGTLDAFIRHFVLLPGCASTSTARPIILDSWDALGVEIRLLGADAFRGDPVSLDLFDPETNIIDPERIGHAGLKSHVRQHQARYQRVAENRRRGLLGAGYLSVSDARVQTSNLIRDPVVGAALIRALRARFHEVMMDEGQDCNPFDLQILSWLKDNGVPVTFVCDPNQAIYEFRDGDPIGIQRFKATYPVESHRELTGNFRSSPAICQLAATLRRGGQVDQPAGDAAAVPYPVILLTYRGQVSSGTIGRAFVNRVAELGLDPTDAIVLAHSGKVAQRAAGVALNDSNGSSRIESVARMVSKFWSPAATGRSREAVIQSVEKLLLELTGQSQQNEHLLRTIERLGLDRRALRRRATSFLMSLPKTCADSDADRLTWVTHVRSGAERLNLPLPAGVTVRRFFQQPPNGKWSNHLQPFVDLGLRCAKIHEAKGHEYGAVCVVIPPNRAPNNRGTALFESWEARTDTEAKRVVYVGLTRAKHLSALAVPFPFADRCVALLRAGQVPYIRNDL